MSGHVRRAPAVDDIGDNVVILEQFLTMACQLAHRRFDHQWRFGGVDQFVSFSWLMP
jgi:hypothetical protein